MSKSLDEIVSEMRTRRDELAPLATEYTELNAALEALDGGAVPPEPERGRTRRTPRAARAPRGANIEAIVRLVGERPGVSPGEIAQATGIGKATVYTTLGKLMREGALEATALPGGGSKGYRVVR